MDGIPSGFCDGEKLFEGVALGVREGRWVGASKMVGFMVGKKEGKPDGIVVVGILWGAGLGKLVVFDNPVNEGISV